MVKNPMVRWSNRELPKLRGMGDHLKMDVAKPLQIADELFCLVVPTNGANYILLNFLSHWIIEALTCKHVPTKQSRKRGW